MQGRVQVYKFFLKREAITSGIYDPLPPIVYYTLLKSQFNVCAVNGDQKDALLIAGLCVIRSGPDIGYRRIQYT